MKGTFGIETSDVRATDIPETLREEYIRMYKTSEDTKIKILLFSSYELIDFVLDPYEDEGIHAQVRRLSDKKIFILPLDYLKVKPRKSKNFELIDDYGVWFVNYR